MNDWPLAPADEGPIIRSGRLDKLREDFSLLLAAASTPLQPMGGDGISRCRLCYEALPQHAAGCLVERFARKESS